MIFAKTIFSLAFIFALVSVQPALAKQPLLQQERQTLRAELKAALKEDLKDKTATKASAIKFTGKHTKIVGGELTAIDGKTLTVSKDGTDYSVTVTDKTKLRRRFWGKAELGEFSVNDQISVYGKWTNEAKTAIEATLIRNLSIQKRRGTFFGVISSIDGLNLVVKTNKRGDQKVILDNKTKIVNRKMQTMQVADLQTGDRIRLKGLWDQANDTITEVTQVKDFSRPTKVSPSPSPTP